MNAREVLLNRTLNNHAIYFKRIKVNGSVIKTCR